MTPHVGGISPRQCPSLTVRATELSDVRVVTSDFPKSSLRRCQRGRIPREISQGINHLRYAQSSELKGEV